MKRRTRIILLFVLYTLAYWFAQGCVERMLSSPKEEIRISNPSRSVDRQWYPTEQARLLKLHMVRPDLIPYPLDLRFYC